MNCLNGKIKIISCRSLLTNTCTYDVQTYVKSKKTDKKAARYRAKHGKRPNSVQ